MKKSVKYFGIVGIVLIVFLVFAISLLNYSPIRVGDETYVDVWLKKSGMPDYCNVNFHLDYYNILPCRYYIGVCSSNDDYDQLLENKKSGISLLNGNFGGTVVGQTPYVNIDTSELDEDEIDSFINSLYVKISYNRFGKEETIVIDKVKTEHLCY